MGRSRSGLSGGSGDAKRGAKGTKDNAGITSFEKQEKNYQKIADANRARMIRNPYNILYKNETYNYQTLADAASNLDPHASKFSGIEGIVAMDAAPNGATVQIDGILFNGVYTKQRMKTAFGTGDVWVDSEGHSFAANAGTIMGSLNQISGGRLVDNRKVKVTFK